jgi:hypothetical protein
MHRKAGAGDAIGKGRWSNVSPFEKSIISSKELAKLYLENWYKHREHSEKYEAR